MCSPSSSSSQQHLAPKRPGPCLHCMPTWNVSASCACHICCSLHTGTRSNRPEYRSSLAPSEGPRGTVGNADVTRRLLHKAACAASKGQGAHCCVGSRLRVAAVGAGPRRGLGDGVAVGVQAVLDGLAAGSRLCKGVRLAIRLRQSGSLCTATPKADIGCEGCEDSKNCKAQSHEQVCSANLQQRLPGVAVCATHMTVFG